MQNGKVSSSIPTVACLLMVAGATASTALAQDRYWDSLKLWYDEPAQKWTEALPVGNGRLGAMVFGGVEAEHIQLNEDTVWAGHPIERDRVGAYKHLPKIRQLIFDGKNAEAQRLMQREFMGPRLIRSYLILLGERRKPDEVCWCHAGHC